jgi:hypothetical protein
MLSIIRRMNRRARLSNRAAAKKRGFPDLSGREAAKIPPGRTCA